MTKLQITKEELQNILQDPEKRKTLAKNLRAEAEAIEAATPQESKTKGFCGILGCILVGL